MNRGNKIGIGEGLSWEFDSLKCYIKMKVEI